MVLTQPFVPTIAHQVFSGNPLDETIHDFGILLSQLSTILLLMLVVALGGTFFLEQPSSSLMGEYGRFREFAEKLKAPWTQTAI